MSSRHLLVATAALEAGLGLAMLLSPALPVSLLIGAPLATVAGIVAGRVAGAALLALGVACWLARNEAGPAATALLAGMLVYNLAVAGVLAHGSISLGLSGAMLWGAILLHAALATWCLACLRVNSRRPRNLAFQENRP